MSRRVVVTGIGLAAGAARDRESFAKACFDGAGSIRSCTAFDPSGLSTAQFGEVEGLAAADEPNGRYFELLRQSAWTHCLSSRHTASMP